MARMGGGLNADIREKIPDLFNTVVGSPVDFKYIGTMAVDDVCTYFTGVAGLWGRALGANHCLGQNSCNSGFACSPGAGKQHCMCHTIRSYGIGQGRGDMLLAHNIIKCLRPVF